MISFNLYLFDTFDGYINKVSYIYTLLPEKFPCHLEPVYLFQLGFQLRPLL